MSKLNKTYAESQTAAIANLTEHASYDKATAHTTFSAEKFSLPEGVTPESIKTHKDLFIDITGAIEEATAQQTLAAHKADEKILTTTGSLELGGVVFTSQHHLQQKIGDHELFGGSVTSVDYIYSPEATEWAASMRANNASIAEDLFK